MFDARSTVRRAHTCWAANRFRTPSKRTLFPPDNARCLSYLLRLDGGNATLLARDTLPDCRKKVVGCGGLPVAESGHREEMPGRRG